MTKKGDENLNGKTSGDGSAGSFADRDLVTFYSRLAHTLENVCGRDRLSTLLAAAGNQTQTDLEPEAVASVLRAFRRMGLVTANRNPRATVEAFVRETADAVSRPEQAVALLLRLFVFGDEDGRGKPVCGPTPQCLSCLLSRECEQFNHPAKPEMMTLAPPARLLGGNALAVSDAELLSVLLHGDKATGRESQVEALMARYGRLSAVAHADAHEFLGMRDMSRLQALRLAAMNELYRRLLEERRDEFLRISSSRDLHDRYGPELRSSRTESAVLAILDAQNQVIRDVWFEGQSLDSSHVSVRDLMRTALREYAVRVALVHNHPAANPQPSISDLDFTRQLRAACDLVGLGLVDHIIIAERGYYSFAEEGMLGL